MLRACSCEFLCYEPPIVEEGDADVPEAVELPEIIVARKRQQRKERIAHTIENIYQPVTEDIPAACRAAYQVANDFAEGPLHRDNLRVWRGLLSLNPSEVSEEANASFETLYEVAEAQGAAIALEELVEIVHEHQLRLQSRLDVLMTIFVMWDAQVRLYPSGGSPLASMLTPIPVCRRPWSAQCGMWGTC